MHIFWERKRTDEEDDIDTADDERDDQVADAPRDEHGKHADRGQNGREEEEVLVVELNAFS